MTAKTKEKPAPEGKAVRGEAFRILHIFFPVISIRRPDVLPEATNVSMNAEIQYGYDRKTRRHLVNLRMTTSEKSEALLTAEIVASCFFEYIREGEPTEGGIIKFVNEFAATAMTSRVIQLIGILTTQMGMTPVWLPMPRGFGLTVHQLRQMKKAMRSGEAA